MLEETQVDLKYRVLRLSGVVDPEIFPLVRAGLPSECQAEECFFVDYSYADLRIPKPFEVIFNLSRPEEAELMPITILAVTQQFSRVFHEIPHGWATICWLGPAANLSTTLKSLPRRKAWDSPTIGLASSDSWTAIKLARSEP
jgi:hypothetical protein